MISPFDLRVDSGKACRWLAALFALLAVSALLGGCSSDCGWHSKTQAFVDENANGKWDGNEPPLSGARFFVTDASGKSGYGGHWVSDGTGTAYLSFFVACNRVPEFLVFAAPPEGYRLTSPELVEAGSQSGQTFTFGFTENK